MYESVEEWLKAEHPGWLDFLHHPNESTFWKRAKANKIDDTELQLHIESSLWHNPGGATFGWCSMVLHARRSGKLPTAD